MKQNRVVGPLITDETENALLIWTKRTQLSAKESDNFKKGKTFLDIKENKLEIYGCHGPIQRDFPVYLPPDTKFNEEMVEQVHKKTLHTRVSHK